MNVWIHAWMIDRLTTSLLANHLTNSGRPLLLLTFTFITYARKDARQEYDRPPQGGGPVVGHLSAKPIFSCFSASPDHTSNAYENARFQLGVTFSDTPKPSFPVLKARLRRALGSTFYYLFL